MSDITDLFEDIASPVASKHEENLEIVPSPSTKEGLPRALKKQKFPPTSKRLYVPIAPGTGSQNCLPLASTGIFTASFFKTHPRDALRVSPEHIYQTSHENLVNLQELYLSQTSVILTYDSWGISLQEICRLSNIFARDERSVATICNETLQGLRYIHNTIGIIHGSISCGTIILTESGRVKITDIGDSMISSRTLGDRRIDYQAVCRVSEVLLELDSVVKPQTMLRLEAENFAKSHFETDIDELLNHAFLRSRIETCALQPFPILLKFLQLNL